MIRPSILMFLLSVDILSFPAFGQGITTNDRGLHLQTAHRAIDMRLAGYFQIDFRSFSGIHPNPPDSLLFRRVRPEFSGTLLHRFDFRILPDFAGGSSSLVEAFVDTRFPKVTVRAGKFRAPLGLERLQSTVDLMFIERALTTGIGPNRDWGVQVSGDSAKKRVAAAFGVFQGAADGVFITAGNNDGMDLGARVFATPWRDPSTQTSAVKRALGGLGFGIGATVGKQRGPTLGFYRTFGQSTFFSFAEGVALSGIKVRYSPQAYYYAGRFGVLTEYIRSEQVMSKNGVESSVSNSAWQVAGSWILTGEAKSYRAVEPTRPVFPNWGRGSVELVARIGGMYLDPVMQVRGLADTKSPSTAAHEWVVGANWYLTHNVRAGANYAHTSFSAIPSVTPRPNENAVLARIQVAF